MPFLLDEFVRFLSSLNVWLSLLNCFMGHPLLSVIEWLLTNAGALANPHVQRRRRAARRPRCRFRFGLRWGLALEFSVDRCSTELDPWPAPSG